MLSMVVGEFAISRSIHQETSIAFCALQKILLRLTTKVILQPVTLDQYWSSTARYDNAQRYQFDHQNMNVLVSRLREAGRISYHDHLGHLVNCTSSSWNPLASKLSWQSDEASRSSTNAQPARRRGIRRPTPPMLGNWVVLEWR